MYLKVVIIGNGFDLYHGMKTSFDDYRNFLVLNKQGKHFEEIKSIIDKLEWENGIESLISEIDNITNDHKIKTWSNFEKCFDVYVDSILKNTNNNQTNEYLEKTHVLFSLIFEYYLKTLEKPNNPYLQFSKILKNADKIITFNYTKTYEMYLNQEEIREKVIHMHGQLDKPQSLIIGYDDSDDIVSRSINPDIGNLEYGTKNYFHKRYLKIRQSNITFNNELEKLDVLMGQTTKLTVLGWSFGESDNYFKTVIKNLLPVYPNNMFIQPEERKVLNSAEIEIYTRESDYIDVDKPFLEKILPSFPTLKILGTGLIPERFTPLLITKKYYESNDKLTEKSLKKDKIQESKIEFETIVPYKVNMPYISGFDVDVNELVSKYKKNNLNLNTEFSLKDHWPTINDEFFSLDNIKLNDNINFIDTKKIFNSFDNNLSKNINFNLTNNLIGKFGKD